MTELLHRLLMSSIGHIPMHPPCLFKLITNLPSNWKYIPVFRLRIVIKR